MPDREFELYLSLLSRLLRLKPAQMREISDELRDHLESRLEELAAQGVPRETAIQAALEEFGDAAELAQYFTHVTRLRRRRFVMRLTAGTVLAATASLLLVAAFSPMSAPTGAIRIAQAQSRPAPAEIESSRLTQAATDETEAKLDQPITVQYVDVPLRDVLSSISESLQVDILVTARTLENAGITGDMAKSLEIKYSKVTARTALELILAEWDLSFTVRDGLIHVIGREDANELVVYPIQDLIRSPEPPPAAPAGGNPPRIMSGGAGSTTDSTGRLIPAAQAVSSAVGVAAAQFNAGMGDGAGGGGLQTSYTARTVSELVMTTIAPDTWESNGGRGTLIEYDGMLVVNQNPAVHSRIVKLLKMLRAAKTARPDRDYPATGKIPTGTR